MELTVADDFQNNLDVITSVRIAHRRYKIVV